MDTIVKYINCDIATMESHDTPYGMISQGAICIRNGKIMWVGAQSDLPAKYLHYPTQNLQGRLVTPALIDCHTHLVFGGSRTLDFERRLNNGHDAKTIENGGSIISTVKATQDASFNELLHSAQTRVEALTAEGVSVIEIKSGYGQTIEDELRILRVAKKLEERCAVKVTTTYLAAYGVPDAYEGKNDRYIDDVVIPGLRRGAREGLIDAVDGHCDAYAFTIQQMSRVFNEAEALGLPVKLHADQFSNQKGGMLSASYKGLSADHLEYLPEADAALLKTAGTVAVLLPGTAYTLKEDQLPPIKALRQNNVPMAIATDCNPVSSPISSILTIMSMACNAFSFTPEEALAGVTRNAAKALGLDRDYGTIEIGKEGDLAVWNLKHPSELSYWMGGTPLYKRITHRSVA